jgi:hypothetical protein
LLDDLRVGDRIPTGPIGDGKGDRANHPPYEVVEITWPVAQDGAAEPFLCPEPKRTLVRTMNTGPAVIADVRDDYHDGRNLHRKRGRRVYDAEALDFVVSYRAEGGSDATLDGLADELEQHRLHLASDDELIAFAEEAEQVIRDFATFLEARGRRMQRAAEQLARLTPC